MVDGVKILDSSGQPYQQVTEKDNKLRAEANNYTREEIKLLRELMGPRRQLLELKELQSKLEKAGAEQNKEELDAIKKKIDKTKELADAYDKEKNSYSALIKEFLSGSNIGQAASALGKQTGDAVSGAFTKEFGSSLGLPPGLEKMGIWGIILGVSIEAINYEQYMRTNAAQVMTAWRTIAPNIKGDIKTEIDDMRLTMQKSLIGTWQFIASKEELTKVFSKALIPSGKDIGDTDGISAFVDKTMKADLMIGRGFGTTIDRLTQQMTMFGLSTEKAHRNVDNLTGFFSGMGTQYALAYGQTLFDLQGRLGALGMDTPQLAGMMRSMGGAAADFGRGGADFAQRGVQGVYNMINKLPEGLQAVLGSVTTGGKVNLEAKQNFQMLRDGLEVNKKGIQDYIPEMMAILSDTYTLRGDSEVIAREKLKGVGADSYTAALIAKISRKTGSREEFMKAFSAEADMNQIKEGLGVKDKQKSFEEIAQELMAGTSAQTNAIEKVIRDVATLLFEFLGIIVNSLTAMVLILMDPFDSDNRKDVGAFYKKSLVSSFSNINDVGLRLADSLGDAIPGGGFFRNISKSKYLENTPGSDTYNENELKLMEMAHKLSEQRESGTQSIRDRWKFNKMYKEMFPGRDSEEGITNFNKQFEQREKAAKEAEIIRYKNAALSTGGDSKIEKDIIITITSPASISAQSFDMVAR